MFCTAGRNAHLILPEMYLLFQYMLADMLEILISCQGHAVIFVEREKVVAVETLALA